jgi:hypothetical protein
MGIALGGGQTAVGRFELERVALTVLDGDDIWNTGSHAHAFEDRALDGGAPTTIGRVKREHRGRGTNGQMLKYSALYLLFWPCGTGSAVHAGRIFHAGRAYLAL